MQAIVRSSQELNKSRENTSSDNQTGLGFSLNGDDLKENICIPISHFRVILRVFFKARLDLHSFH